MMSKSNVIRILNTLMRYDRPLTTKELCDIADCNRKTVYASVNTLELKGFGVTIEQIADGPRKINTYKFNGIHGLNEV